MILDQEKRHKLIALGVLAAFMTVVGIGYSFTAWQDFRTLGTSPKSMTLEEAVPSPDSTPSDARWVSLSGLTDFSCSQILKEHVGTSDLSDQFLGSDSTHRRLVLVKTRDMDHGCGSLSEPVSGILKKADSSLPDWLRKKGMTVPPSTYPLMEFEVAADTSGARMQVYFGFSTLLIGIVLSIIFFRLRSLWNVPSPMATARPRVAPARN